PSSKSNLPSRSFIPVNHLFVLELEIMFMISNSQEIYFVISCGAPWLTGYLLTCKTNLTIGDGIWLTLM
ncbi:MAG: hypothetical protein KAU03_07085, partial [Candidatus Altiarchaeales archaeon]|nr:hypothetical protein [Candidatus Altiarchaeales archaeon]